METKSKDIKATGEHSQPDCVWFASITFFFLRQKERKDKNIYKEKSTLCFIKSHGIYLF